MCRVSSDAFSARARVTVHAGHSHIEQHHVGRMLRGQRQCLGSIGCTESGVTLGREQRFEQPAVGHAVVDDQHGGVGCIHMHLMPITC